MPPTIFPTNSPIAVPISPSTLDPSLIIHSNPGICAKPPKAARIAAIPAISIASDAIAVNAPFIGILLRIFAATANSKNINDTECKDSIIFPRAPSSKTSVKAFTNADTRFAIGPTRSGIRSASLLRRIPIRSTNKSTI